MTFCKGQFSPGLNRPSGFTLVELLVASAVIVVAIAAMIAMVRKGMELSTTDGHRRTARAIIASRFESGPFNYSNYLNLIPGAWPPIQVIIDSHGEGVADDLNGTLTTVVGNETTVPGANDIQIPYKNIAMTVAWQEPEGAETVVIEKRLAQVQ
jgi:prepilin-type N-terminal cleavage/methylation domain-containing protein